jgi:hypothetical protein
MRRLFALVLVATTVAVAGCAGPPSGTDGNLINNWSALPAAGPEPVAAVGSCHDYRAATFQFDMFRQATLTNIAGTDEVRDCVSGDETATHDSETAYVGTFTGADAAQQVPPVVGSVALHGAYSQCQLRASEYLGGDWHSGSVALLLVLPTEKAWQHGARWYRCDIGHVDDPFSLVQVVHGTVRDGLSGARPLELTCLTTGEDAEGVIQRAAAVDCDEPHAAEYAGYYTAPVGYSWPDDPDEITELAMAGCDDVVGRYLGFPSGSESSNDEVGLMALGFDQDRWQLGDHSTRCYAYAYTDSKVIIGSVRGLRSGTPHS